MGKRALSILLCAVFLSSLAACSSEGTTTSTASTQTAQASPKEEKKKIMLDDYNSITTGDSLTGDGGTSYDDVVKKVGEPSSKSESQSGDLKMVMASWTKNINGELGANFNVTFINGKASSKSQFSMK